LWCLGIAATLTLCQSSIRCGRPRALRTKNPKWWDSQNLALYFVSPWAEFDEGLHVQDIESMGK
jgi:hypothetical protein